MATKIATVFTNFILSLLFLRIKKPLSKQENGLCSKNRKILIPFSYAGITQFRFEGYLLRKQRKKDVSLTCAVSTPNGRFKFTAISNQNKIF